MKFFVGLVICLVVISSVPFAHASSNRHEQAVIHPVPVVFQPATTVSAYRYDPANVHAALRPKDLSIWPSGKSFSGTVAPLNLPPAFYPRGTAVEGPVLKKR